jgi:putative hydrolase of the HAD superfamily
MDCILFDLDNTLYSAEQELFPLIDRRINSFMHEVAGIPRHEVDNLRRTYWQRYGVTMQGLMRHHGVDPEAYLAYVHDIDLTGRLAPDPALRRVLETLPQRLAVFTNSSTDHSERVLARLGLSGAFEEIFDIRVAGYVPKPHPEPYHAVLSRLGAEPDRCIMVEDSLDNLRTAKELGMGTILVGPRSGAAWVDVTIDRAAQVGEALRFWNAAAIPVVPGNNATDS